MGNFETIIFEKQAAIAKITLNRPDAANGLNSQMGDELNQIAKLCDTDPELKVVVPLLADFSVLVVISRNLRVWGI